MNLFNKIESKLLEESAALTPVINGKNSRDYKCSVDNCERLARAKGLCNTHYIRMRKGYEMHKPIRNRRTGTVCSICGDLVNGKGGWGLCAQHYKAKRFKIIKTIVVEHFGDKCGVCNNSYPDECYDFHHRDPDKKEYSISNLLVNGSILNIAKEVEKCELLCANCHRVKHTIMNKFLKCIDIIFRHEGGYVNHPADPGKATNMGITELFYPDLDIRNLTKPEAQEIYYNDYWLPMGLNDIEDPLAVLHIFDMGVNCRNKTQGFKKIIRLAQEIVGTNKDGRMGPITVKAINEKEDFVKLYIQARKDYYKARTVSNKKLKVFLKGWYRRVDSTKL